MPNLLILYNTKTGNTERMAHAVADGAKKVKGTKVVVLKVDDAKMNDLKDSDAIILGSPTYYGNMTGKMKSFIDRTNGINGKLKGKVGGAFTSSGDTACGAETAILSMLEATMWRWRHPSSAWSAE
jgi:NAD(P)H dehydrogenase (quinone)